MLLVSKCLLGENCKYNGGNNRNEAVLAYLQDKPYIAVCPEYLGGLPIPREPSEIVGDRVVSRTGRDVTAEYRRGAERTLALAQKYGCRAAWLKEKSPSCGTGTVHNGKFDGGLVEGYGITARLLRKNGIAVFGESQTDALIAFLGDGNEAD